MEHAVHVEEDAADHPDVVFSEVVGVEHHGAPDEVLETRGVEGPHGVATADGVVVAVAVAVSVFQVGGDGGEVDDILDPTRTWVRQFVHFVYKYSAKRSSLVLRLVDHHCEAGHNQCLSISMICAARRAHFRLTASWRVETKPFRPQKITYL